ncbi:hypothetical protein GWK47_000643 [Chionoecetes opilio]|uniref:Uncharacterized protein n=1 Tax=Chionoecetes opilio TaxID=41210 RepID=A0A8J4Y710_CHIOP|nr:hypothetical protein GWK47_000643 [Chionoecetes opilio]
MLPPGTTYSLLPWRVLVTLMQLCSCFPYRIPATSDPPVFSLPLCLWNVFLQLLLIAMNCIAYRDIFVGNLSSDIGTAVYIYAVTAMTVVAFGASLVTGFRSSMLANMLHDLSVMKYISPPPKYRWYHNTKTIVSMLLMVIISICIGGESLISMNFPMSWIILFGPLAFANNAMLLLPQELPAMVFGLLARRLLVATEATVVTVSGLLAPDGYFKRESDVTAATEAMRDLQAVVREVEVQREKGTRYFFPVTTLFLLMGAVLAITGPYALQKSNLPGLFPSVSQFIACYIMVRFSHMGQDFVNQSLEVLVMALEALHEEAKPLGLEASWLKTRVQVGAAEELLKDLRVKSEDRGLNRKLMNTVVTYLVIILQVATVSAFLANALKPFIAYLRRHRRHWDAAAGHRLQPVAVACTGDPDAAVQLLPLQDTSHKRPARVQHPAVPVECTPTTSVFRSDLQGRRGHIHDQSINGHRHRGLLLRHFALMVAVFVASLVTGLRSSMLAAMLHDLSVMKDISPPPRYRWYHNTKTILSMLLMVIISICIGRESTIGMNFPMLWIILFTPLSFVCNAMLLLPEELPAMVFGLLARRLLVATEATVVTVSGLLAPDGSFKCESDVKAATEAMRDLQAVIREVEVQREKGTRCFFPVTTLFLLMGVVLAITGPYALHRGNLQGLFPYASLFVGCYIMVRFSHMGQDFVNQVSRVRQVLRGRHSTKSHLCDMVLLFAESLEVLVMALEALHEEAKPLGLEASWLKTKVQVFRSLLDETVKSVHACRYDIEI